MKKTSKVPIAVIILAGLLLSVCNVLFCLDYTKKLDTVRKVNIDNSIDLVMDWQSNVVQQVIRDSKSRLKNFALSGDILDLLKDSDNPELIKKGQEYTERYYANLDNWEGLYVEDWNTKVLCHNIPEKIGIIVRKDDTIEQFRKSMTDNPEGMYFNGAVESSATGEYVMSFCYMIKDENGEPIGAVGGAPYLKNLSGYFNKIDMSSANAESYSLINTVDCIYAFHSDISHIGEEVMDAAHLKILEYVENGSTEGSYSHNGKIVSYRTLPGTKYILALTCDEAKFNGAYGSVNVFPVVFLAAIEILLAGLVVLGVYMLSGSKKHNKAVHIDAVEKENAESGDTPDVR